MNWIPFDVHYDETLEICGFILTVVIITFMHDIKTDVTDGRFCKTMAGSLDQVRLY